MLEPTLPTVYFGALMSTLSPEILRLGQPSAPATAIPLKAGPLTAYFLPETGYLRYIRIGDHEILRGIYGTVRDQQWQTLVPRIGAIEVHQDPSPGKGFRITFTAHYEHDELAYQWKGTLTGNEKGTIRYEFDGKAGSDFPSNRIGLCVLYPITECAGKTCQVTHPDGSNEEVEFPRHAFPGIPFGEIQTMRHQPAPGVEAEVQFSGASFELEDQRNWGDASYKVYAPAAKHPIPVAFRKGDTLQQGVEVRLPGEPRRILPVVQGRGAQFSITTTPVLPKPAIGLQMASHGQSLGEVEVARLKKLGLSHLRVDLQFSNEDWRSDLSRAIRESAAMDVSLQLALHLANEPERSLKELATNLNGAETRINLWQVLDEETGEETVAKLKMAQQILAEISPNTLFACGSDVSFGHLNRNRPATGQSALPCYPLHPQVHAQDEWTLVENAAAHPMTVESLQQFAPRAAVISPVTLGPRSTPGFLPSNLPEGADPRQMSLFGAGWTLASLSALVTGGNLHSMTFYETTGCQGLMAAASGSPFGEDFPSVAGGVFPVYHLFADLAGYQRVLPTLSSHPLQTTGMTLIDAANRRRVLIANLMGEEQEVRIKSGSCHAMVRYLDETNGELAMRDPETFRADSGSALEARAGKLALALKPFGLACVDILP